VIRPLFIRDVGELLQWSAHARNIVLVGGQALNVWAVRFGLAAEATAVSRDIDFFGSRADAIAAGLDWHASVETAALDDHTPNAAVVIVNIDNEERGIDFLSSIAGVDSEELQRWAATIRGGTYEFRLMHPLHVLQSQLENVYGTLHRRDEPGGEYYVARASLSIEVAKAALVDMLDAGRWRESLRAAERIAKLAVTRVGLAAWARDSVDVSAAIPAHAGWPKRLVATQLPQIERDVRTRRGK
jgi:hypothetical protein